MRIKDWREVVKEDFLGDSDNDPSGWVKYVKNAPPYTVDAIMVEIMAQRYRERDSDLRKEVA